MHTWDMWSLFTNIQEQQSMLKISLPYFSGIYELHWQITQELLGLKIQNFQGIDFIWTQTYWEIFKPALVYL